VRPSRRTKPFLSFFDCVATSLLSARQRLSDFWGEAWRRPPIRITAFSYRRRFDASEEDFRPGPLRLDQTGRKSMSEMATTCEISPPMPHHLGQAGVLLPVPAGCRTGALGRTPERRSATPSEWGSAPGSTAYRNPNERTTSRVAARLAVLRLASQPAYGERRAANL